MHVEKHNPVGDVVPAAIPKTARILMSRNEIATLCFKAARGAGMSWGHAEEAGQAAAWLALYGLDGPKSLAAHLQGAAGKSWQDVCPDVRPGLWETAAGTPLCPISLGATLCDFAALPDLPLANEGLETGPVSRPLLVLPFLSAVAEALGKPVRLSWPGGDIDLGPEGQISGATEALAKAETERLLIRTCTLVGETTRKPVMAPVGSETLEFLNALAMKTTVPPSDRSRAGAGGGTSDND